VHEIENSVTNPSDECTSTELTKQFSNLTLESPEGFPQISHNGHLDYIVNERLLHFHQDHYDDHGPIQVLKPLQ
jgi:hypothetical protein